MLGSERVHSHLFQDSAHTGHVMLEFLRVSLDKRWRNPTLSKLKIFHLKIKLLWSEIFWEKEKFKIFVLISVKNENLHYLSGIRFLGEVDLLVRQLGCD